MQKIRNVAIIAHVDHGKTTLVDELLKQSKVFRDNQEVQECFLDSNDLERERGITILAKNISIKYGDYKINLIDTPGHSDFSGEVERVLKLADGVLLLVDSFEGPMPQTRFVLEKALQLELQPIVVINKIDRTDNRPAEVLNEIYDLFIELGADDDQIDFAVIYASGRNGWAVTDLAHERKDLVPLLDTIVKRIPAPKKPEGSLQMQIAALDYSSYVGRIGIGRVFRGHIDKKKPLVIIKRSGDIHNVSIKQLFIFEGLGRTEVETVQCGEICAMVGIEDIDIGDTIADLENPEPLPLIAIDEPTISLTFTVNTSPFHGREGKYVTSRHLRERLFKELQQNVALKVHESGSSDMFIVSGRGILHLSILIENMRREGYEFTVGAPKVIFKEIDGKKMEPIDLMTVECPAEYSGKVIDLVGQRKGVMIKMDDRGSMTRMEFHIPARGMMGLRNSILNVTTGEGIMHHRFYQYEYFKGSIKQRQNGTLISMGEGFVTDYALNGLQDRGIFFVDSTDEVYAGQIVGENNKDNDLEVNVQRGKKMSNMRAAGSDKTIKIAPSVKFSLEEAMEYIRDDEMVEVTPKNIRMRKLHLDAQERKRISKLADG
ncbi:MAG: GTP-binding protein TypA [Spirochaetes bacterium GWF1_51_8]|nr:MAG: GTP-binding protein TypA [Spirochaetes bacterium GWF1_51_8]